MELLRGEKDLIDAIINTTTYNELFDEILKVGFGESTNNTVSNMPLFHHHRIQYIDMDNFDREKEKRDIILNLAAQVCAN